MRLACQYTDAAGNHAEPPTVRCESLTLIAQTAGDLVILTRLARLLQAGGSTTGRAIVELLQHVEVERDAVG